MQRYMRRPLRSAYIALALVIAFTAVCGRAAAAGTVHQVPGPAALAAAPAPGAPTAGITVESAGTGAADPAAEARRHDAERALFERMLAERSVLPAAAPIDAPLASTQRDAIAGGSTSEVPLKVGATVEVDQRVDFAAAGMDARGAVAIGPGFAAMLPDGAVVWEAAVSSPAATALRLRLSGFDLAEGVSLHVYNEAGQVRGPYTGRGPDAAGGFWSDSVFGDRLRLHVRAGTAAALAASRFTISGVVHMGPRYHVAETVARSYIVGPEPADRDFCGVVVPTCTINGVCGIDANPGLTDASNAVAQIDFMSGGDAYICSGTLINPTGSVRTPYFLTANHCISTQSEAGSLQAHFRFRTTTCTTCTMASVVHTSGSTLMATGAAPTRPDFTLLRLSSAPAGLMLLGWSAGQPPEGAYLIHLGHPGGSPLAYSVRRVRYSAAVLPGCATLPRPTFLYSGVASASGDAEGAIAGGSSGGSAILLNGSGSGAYIVGQLTGHCSSGDPPDLCDANTSGTVDGALEHSFPYLRPFLYERIFSDGFQ